MELNLSAVWPDWEISAPISKGTFGQVYKAVRKKNDDVAAVKIISLPPNMDDIEAKQRTCSDETIKASYKDQAEAVLAEIKIMKELVGSSNIVGIQDYELVEKPGGIGYDIYIRMELLQPMESRLIDLELNQNCAQFVLPEEEIIKIGSDICRALETCHGVTTETKKQIIHRDIKPANILYHKNSDSYKLGDFGVSKELEVADSNLTRSIGTCNYMAPEVINSRFYDFRADIYSLGLVLYCLANKKRLPFVKEVGRYKEEQEAFERRIAGELLPPPECISTLLADIILKACAYKPEDRYGSAKEFRLALESAMAKTPIQKNPQPELVSQETAIPVPVVGEFGPKKRKWKGLMVGLACLVALILGLFFAADILPIDRTKHPDDTLSGTLSSTDGDSKGPLESTGDFKTDTTTATEQTQPSTNHTGSTDPDANIGGNSHDAGISRENALPIEINVEHQKTIAVDGEIDWYGFTTAENNSIYRIFVNSKINGNPINGKTTFALYDADGIKQKEHTLDYGASGYFDVYLSANSQYTVKISAENTVPVTGDYLLQVIEKPTDAGTDQATAKALEVGSRYTGRLDSSMSDWYVFTFEKSGKYILQLHNIDTGCRIEADGWDELSGFVFSTSLTVKNEDSGSRIFSVEAGEKIYVEIKPWSVNDADKANGTYIVLITEQEVT